MERIVDYALLSNCQGSALVSRAGSIDWACLPAFDSPAMFARILGEPGGFWSITPTEPIESTRAYVEDTMVLRTEMRTSTGVVAVTDFLPLHPDDKHNDIGRRSPAGLHRIAEGVEGEVELAVEIAVRPEYGLTTPLLQETDPGVWLTRGGPITVTIASDVALEPMEGVLTGRRTMRPGDRAGFALCVADPWHDPTPMAGDVFQSLEDTVAGWQSWAEKLIGYDGDHRELLRRSAVVLRSLNYAPTGAIVAAPTTSLPEEIGGVRNWDYRFTWVRDMSFSLGALAASGCAFEAEGFFDFFANATAGSLAAGQGLQIMYGIRGERLIPEHALTHLAGHRGSRPVRMGNGAFDQTQLDVFGELLDAAARIAELGIDIDP
ncbi:MAG: hypothetical protein QOF40_934, partial [Actinomycetota bacterium]|nr:hypothetical protein [Actinomycetota bacterium]